MRCSHDELHDITSRYDRDALMIHWVAICHACGADVREIHAQEYAPRRVDPERTEAGS